MLGIGNRGKFNDFASSSVPPSLIFPLDSGDVAGMEESLRHHPMFTRDSRPETTEDVLSCFGFQPSLYSQIPTRHVSPKIPTYLVYPFMSQQFIFLKHS